jgi:hypothetical protein
MNLGPNWWIFMGSCIHELDVANPSALLSSACHADSSKSHRQDLPLPQTAQTMSTSRLHDTLALLLLPTGLSAMRWALWSQYAPRSSHVETGFKFGFAQPLRSISHACLHAPLLDLELGHGKYALLGCTAYFWSVRPACKPPGEDVRERSDAGSSSIWPGNVLCRQESFVCSSWMILLAVECLRGCRAWVEFF